MRKWIHPLALAALFCTGCTSTYHSARFAPAPLEVRLATEGEGQGRALISVRGIRNATKEEPARVEMAMRLENMGSGTMRLREESLQLLSADLASAFEPGRVVGGDATQAIPPGGEGAYEMIFQLIPGRRLDDLDLRGLNLRWTTSFEGQDVTTGITFERVFYDPYSPVPRTTVGVGIGIHG